MGFPAFAKIFRYGILAAVALAAALVAVIALASPASAWRDGGDHGHPELVDTDNLKYTGTVNGRSYTYSAKSFGIPYLDRTNRGSEAACGGSGVADAFFQRSAIRNDMPVVDTSKTEFALTTPSAAGACTTFVQEQNRAQMEAGSNGGYYLDVEGRLRRGLPPHFATDRLAGNDRRVSSNSSSNGFWVSNGRIHYTTQHRSTYADRVDLEVGSDVQYAVHADPPLDPASIKFVIPDPPVVKSASSGGSVRWVPDFSQVSGVNIRNAKALGWGYFQGGGHIGAYCPSLLHPRGEDAVRRIGTGTGRTLSSLKTEANVQTANRFWCRSDKRYVISYETEIEPGVTCSSTDSAPPCPSRFELPANGEEARYYGRVNCYRTVLELKTTATSQTDRNSCAYIFPLPQCTHNGAKTPLNSVQIAKHQIGAVFPFASDGTTACDTNPQCTANGAKRDMTDAELQAYRTARGASFTPASDGSTPCTAAVAASATADFTSDACVTAILEIYENRPKGFNAEPGVRTDHRTITADTANPAFDLDVAAAHPGTASPPRAASDHSGCADGSEGRADHGTAGSAARKNTAAEDAVTTDEVDLPKSSSSINSQHPPHSKNFGSPGTDYTGAVRNIAHRFASDVAENTCAAKKAEAELVLALGKARADMFSRAASGSDRGGYAARYAADVESNRKLFSNTSPRGYKEKLEAVVVDASVHRGYWLSWFNTNKATLVSRANSKKTAADDFKSALDTARANHKRATDAVALRSFSSGSCVAHWDAEIARIAGLFSSADSVFSTAIATSKRAYHTSYDSYVKAIFSATTAAPTSSESVTRSNPFYVTAISITSYYCNQGEGERQGTRCQRPPTTERVRQSYTYSPRQGCIDFVNQAEGITSAQRARGIRQCQRLANSAIGYRYVNVTTTYPSTAAHRNYSRSAARTVTYKTTGAYNGATNPVSSSCPIRISIAWTSEENQPAWPRGGGCTPGKSQSVRYYEAVGASPALPSAPTRLAVASYPTVPAAVPAHKAALLGKYDPANTARNNLNNTTASTRDTAAVNLGTLTSATAGAVTKTSFAASAVTAPYGLTASRTSVETEAGDYKTAYTRAYNTAYSAALADMGSTATTTTWNNFYWSYETSSLVWGGYLADEGQPTRSRGCYLIDVAADGKVTVQTARMDFETGSYAVGETYSFLFSGERNCKVRRTRTPQLNLKYQPDNPNGTDGGLATGYFHTDYQPNTADERFKLQAETEIFTIRAKVADSPPVFCGTTLPADGYLSHTAGQMASVPAVIAKDSWRSAADLATTVLRPTSNPPAIIEDKDHCFARPRLTATDKPRLVVFDDTAHSDMNLVYLQKDPYDTTGINLFTGGAFTRYALETYRYPGDNSQQSVFYGAIWEPPDALGSSTGWDILDDNNPNTDLNTKIKNRIVARDKTASPNLPAVPTSQTFKHVSAMSFNIGFLDCRPDIENVVFIGNITSATSASNQANDYAGITSASGYPMNAPQWYYPAWNEIKGQPRSDGSTVGVGPNSRIYTHPQSARYGWVMAAYNNIATDKQPVVGFWNRPDVKHDDPNRPATVSLEEHRHVCLGDRSALLHYRSANAALPTSNTNRDVLGYPTDPSPPPGLSQVPNSWLVLHINPENKCPRLPDSHPARQPANHPASHKKKDNNELLTHKSRTRLRGGGSHLAGRTSGRRIRPDARQGRDGPRRP